MTYYYYYRINFYVYVCVGALYVNVYMTTRATRGQRHVISLELGLQMIVSCLT